MQKKVMAVLDKCYSVAPLTYQGEPHILVAAEKKDRCILFDMDGREKATVWEGPGGVMSMVQVPGTDGQFLATHQFYSPNDSKNAKIIIATPDGENTWEVRTLTDLPFVHRFDVVKGGDKYYLIACALKSDHEYKDDWRFPGKVYAAELPEDLSVYNEENQLQLTVIKDNMLKNHGYYRTMEDGIDTSVISCENGIFRFTPPQEAGGEWKIETLLETAASDATLVDLDGDGEKELVVLAPFHGDTLSIYRKTDNGYALAWTYPEKAEFLHAIWSGELKGKPCAVIGYRKGARRLLQLTWDQGYHFTTLDDDGGPANVFGFNLEDRDMLVAANRETDEIAMYTFEK